MTDIRYWIVEKWNELRSDQISHCSISVLDINDSVFSQVILVVNTETKEVKKLPEGEIQNVLIELLPLWY